MNDRIAQMAREAELIEQRDDWSTLPRPYTDALLHFARLVAEDCAEHVERKLTEGRSPLGKVAANFVRERYK